MPADDGSVTVAMAPVDPTSPFTVFGQSMPSMASLRANRPDVDAACRVLASGLAAPSPRRCACVNVDFGTYANQVTLDVPPGMDIRCNSPDREPKVVVGVDACLADEIRYLWSLGIVTTGCCCGHGKGAPYIGVEDRFIPAMKALGYRVHHNVCRPGDEDSFVPRSLIVDDAPPPAADTTGRTVDSTGHEATFDG